MATELDAIAGLQRRLEAARQRQVRAAYELEQAEAARGVAISALQAEFGVSTPEGVQQLMVQLDAEVEREMAAVQGLLAVAEGTGVPA